MDILIYIHVNEVANPVNSRLNIGYTILIYLICQIVGYCYLTTAKRIRPPLNNMLEHHPGTDIGSALKDF